MFPLSLQATTFSLRMTFHSQCVPGYKSGSLFASPAGLELKQFETGNVLNGILELKVGGSNGMSSVVRYFGREIMGLRHWLPDPTQLHTTDRREEAPKQCNHWINNSLGPRPVATRTSVTHCMGHIDNDCGSHPFNMSLTTCANHCFAWFDKRFASNTPFPKLRDGGNKDATFA